MIMILSRRAASVFTLSGAHIGYMAYHGAMQHFPACRMADLPVVHIDSRVV
jgi:hypothetical protein